MVKQLLTVTGIMASFMLSAQKNFWSEVHNKSSLSGKSFLERRTLPTDYKIYNLDFKGINAELSKAPERGSQNESFVLKFPQASGKLVDYVVQEAPVLSKELAAKYPGIKSYLGYEKGNSSNSIRFSTSPYDGLNVMYFNAGETSYLDTYTNDNASYIVYERKNLPADPNSFNCLVKEDPTDVTGLKPESSELVQDGQLRTFRLAIACTIEYSAFHVGRAGVGTGTLEEKKAAVLAAMNKTMTRVNGIYEKTVSITMQLVADNDKVIFIDTDNFSNANANALINESQTVIDSLIGTANYDIGHTFSTGGGGLAQLRSPCTASKARGITGSPSPTNDAYDIDYVAHEMGHQWGATHTFDNSCSGNRTSGTSVEPGSGSTIMAYAGICAPNIQTRSDAYFHVVSIAQMYTNLTVQTGSTCGVKTSNNNQTPTADAGPDYTIPAGTAFVLTGTGTDPDGDALTYLWEQTDTRSTTTSTAPTQTQESGVVFRSFFPTTSNQRYFPRLLSIVAGNLKPTWEVIPTVSRVLNFALLVNDNKATGNQSKRDNLRITVAEGQPFAVTSHTAYVEYNGGEATTVTWNVSGTDLAPINTANVQVLLSTDGGVSFPTVLGSFPNNGSASVVLPNINANNARIMVKAVENVFLAVNSSAFAIKEVLAVSEAAFNKGFAIYPNPAKGEVNISLKNVAKGATYQVLDLSGKLISNGTLENEKTQLNISTLKTGTYRIVISNNGETTSKNLIVK